jgi:hypothetical protein
MGKKLKRALKFLGGAAAVATVAYAAADVARERTEQKAKFHDVRKTTQDIRYRSDRSNYAPKGTRKFHSQVENELQNMLRAAELSDDFFM